SDVYKRNVINMSNKNSEKKEEDPLNELNELEDNFTPIETDKDPLNEIDYSDAGDIPEYDSDLGEIIDSKSQTTPDMEVPEKDDSEKTLLEVIDEVDINNVEKVAKRKSTKSVKTDNDTNQDSVKTVESNEANSESSDNNKPKVKPKSRDKTDSKDDKKSVKKIDNVKVDEDGVPLFNQFNSERIRQSNLFKKLRPSKSNIIKIIQLVVGIIITLIGISQALNEVLRLSDNVVYGEHQSIALGLILLGILIILSAFYKQIINYIGLDDLENIVSDDDETTMPKPKSKNKKNK
ncbi:MAG: hypothetical protein LUG89_00980, partial [Methanosphaera sp.]|nr:hypothetical protein [Methanosphaera sp.]